MRFFLIRHGETVDNVAGLYAGSRDSALTTHGVLQTRRLATYLAEKHTLTHLFSSNLVRAVKTAEAVRDAQKRAHSNELAVVQLPELREKHFGSGEGVKYGLKGPKTEHQGAETLEAMKSRIDRFLDDHLCPLVDDDAASICVVSHGIILGVLFTSLYARLPFDSVTVAPDAQASMAVDTALIRPAWSNTGYLEGVFSPLESDDEKTLSRGGQRSQLNGKLLVKAINSIDHIKGLKKTRGGIGSAKFDEKQKTMDSFFKTTSRKRKLQEAVQEESIAP
ncbi:Fc.00g009480.m01.CDS01 [Cosmosporella sp. VM-42]